MIDLNYKEFGLGEPVVILHGLFGTMDNWQTIANYPKCRIDRVE